MFTQGNREGDREGGGVKCGKRENTSNRLGKVRDGVALEDKQLLLLLEAKKAGCEDQMTANSVGE